MTVHRVLQAVSLSAALTLLAPAAASAAVKVGTLRCEVSGGFGLIITSKKELSCGFTSLHGWHEHYRGSIRKFGIDIGKTDRGVLIWEVFAPTEGSRRHALAGDYAGADASVTLGVGGGANVLVGGFERSFTLQPFSIEGQTGVALAAGVADMHLR